jgi:hypothetical protein
MIIEVMAAALVLLVGILGVLTMLDTANGATTRSLAREQGNTLARDVVERARQLSYKTLVAPTAAVTFRQALPDGPSTSAPDGSWTMTRRATDYTVSIKTCKVDETSDGIGRTDSSYCPRTGGTGGGGTGGGGGGSSIGVNIFGISVSATGNVVNLACSLLGPDPVLNNLLASTTGLLGRGVSVGVCPSGAQIVVDPNPDDLTRVSSTVSWTTSGHSQQVVQSTVVPNPAP